MSEYNDAKFLLFSTERVNNVELWSFNDMGLRSAGEEQDIIYQHDLLLWYLPGISVSTYQGLSYESKILSRRTAGRLNYLLIAAQF